MKAGRLDVENVKREMSSSEFEGWMTFYKYEPFGAQWENWLTAMVCNIISCAHFKKSERPNFLDFFYTDEETEKERKTTELHEWLNSKAKRNER